MDLKHVSSSHNKSNSRSDWKSLDRLRHKSLTVRRLFTFTNSVTNFILHALLHSHSAVSCDARCCLRVIREIQQSESSGHCLLIWAKWKYVVLKGQTTRRSLRWALGRTTVFHPCICPVTRTKLLLLFNCLRKSHMIYWDKETPGFNKPVSD